MTTIVRVYNSETRVIIQGAELLAPLIASAQAAVDASVVEAQAAAAAAGIDAAAAEQARTDFADRFQSTPSTGAVITLEDATGHVFGYVDTTTGCWFLNGLPNSVQVEIGAIKARQGFATIEQEFPVYAGAPVVMPDRLGFQGNGQSNSIGANGQPPISTVSTYPGRVIGFNGGPKADASNPTVSMISTVDLVEDTAAGDGGAGRGETFLTGAANGLLERLYRRSGLAPTNWPQIFAHTSGVGGQSIGSMSTTYYARFTTSVQKAKDLATAAGKSFAVGAILYDGHEANQGGTSQAAWQAAMRTFYNQMKASILGITGQAFDPIILLPQKSWSVQPTPLTSSGSANTYPGSVTLGSVAEQGSGLFVAFPDYATFFRSEAVDIHRGPVGHKLAGRYFARAAERILFQKKDWRGLSLRSAWFKDGYCFVRLNVPIQPIVIDFDAVFGVTAQAGFKITDATGNLPIAAVEVVAGDTIRLSLSRTRNGAATLRAGLDFLPSRSGLTKESGGTNVRDSDVEKLRLNGTDYLLANWLLAFETTPLVMEP